MALMTLRTNRTKVSVRTTRNLTRMDGLAPELDNGFRMMSAVENIVIAPLNASQVSDVFKRLIVTSNFKEKLANGFSNQRSARHTFTTLFTIQK